MIEELMVERTKREELEQRLHNQINPQEKRTTMTGRRRAELSFVILEIHVYKSRAYSYR